MERGFFGSLFDLSFTSFVTPKVVKVLYVLTLIFLVVGYVVGAISLFTGGSDQMVVDSTGNLVTESDSNTVAGIIWLVVGPIVMLFWTLLYRVFFEVVIVFFRIYEETRTQTDILLGQDEQLYPQIGQGPGYPPAQGGAPPAQGGYPPDQPDYPPGL